MAPRSGNIHARLLMRLMTIICLGLGVLLSTTGGYRAQLLPPPSGMEMLTLVKAPTSLLDIFANMKVALDRRLMLDGILLRRCA